jgi:cold shock protein
MTQRVHGTLKTYLEDRGFGFIAPDNGERDAFILGSTLRQAGIAYPRVGVRLTFDVERDDRGRDRAVDVQPEGTGTAAAEGVFNPPRHEPVRP